MFTSLFKKDTETKTETKDKVDIILKTMNNIIDREAERQKIQQEIDLINKKRQDINEALAQNLQKQIESINEKRIETEKKLREADMKRLSEINESLKQNEEKIKNNCQKLEEAKTKKQEAIDKLLNEYNTRYGTNHTFYSTEIFETKNIAKNIAEDTTTEQVWNLMTDGKIPFPMEQYLRYNTAGDIHMFLQQISNTSFKNALHLSTKNNAICINYQEDYLFVLDENCKFYDAPLLEIMSCEDISDETKHFILSACKWEKF